MTLDVNDAPEQHCDDQQTSRESHNWDALSDALADRADTIFPELFPQGKIENGELRMADITGRPPRNVGSCVIQLKGEHAGEYYDHSLSRGGGPVATVAHYTGLSGDDLWDYCVELVNRHGGSLDTKKHRPRAVISNKTVDHIIREANFALSHSGPAVGTLVETYLASRGLKLTQTEDILFNDNLTHRDNGYAIGMPAMVAVVRYPDGTPTGGIHRTYLKEDGSGHIGGKKAKKMLGPCESGVIFLAPPDRYGAVGVGEGIETTLAGMQLFGVGGGVAAMSTGGMKHLGDWLAVNRPEALKHLIVFADAGKDGMGAAQYLAEKAISAGIPTKLFVPRSGDDFCDDLVKGLLPMAEVQYAPQPEHSEQISGGSKKDDADAELNGIQVDITNLKEGDYAKADNLVERIAAASLPTLVENKLVADIKRLTSIKPASAIDKALKEAKAKLKAQSKEVARPTASWVALVKRYADTEEIRPMMFNVSTIIRNTPEFRDTIWYNDFTGLITVRLPLPWDSDNGFKERDWTDYDELKMTEWLQGMNDFINAPPHVVFQGVETIAGEQHYHPVREYLDSLVWDGVPRIDNWLITYLGAKTKEADEKYLQAAGARSLISAVARIYRPGIKSDTCLMILGDQGIGKSSLLRMLFDPNDQKWFTDEIAELGSKDASMQMRGAWCIELGELSALRTAELNRVKAFITRTTDRFRPPYGRQLVTCERQCVFAATSNEFEVLHDPTGNRRWLPFWAHFAKTRELWADRHKLWAETVYRYRDGEKFHIDEPKLIEIAKQVQAAHVEHDVWEEPIAEYLAKSHVQSMGATIGEILHHALGVVDKSKWNQAARTRIGTSLQHLGWDWKQKREAGERVRRYYPLPPASKAPELAQPKQPWAIADTSSEPV